MLRPVLTFLCMLAVTPGCLFADSPGTKVYHGAWYNVSYPRTFIARKGMPTRRMDKGDRLWTHAARAVQVLKDRLMIEEQPHVLLRPSTAPTEGTLLHPIGPPHSLDPHLLRPADNEAESA